MQINAEDAAASEERGGRTYFCSRGCHSAFLSDPDRYISAQ